MTLNTIEAQKKNGNSNLSDTAKEVAPHLAEITEALRNSVTDQTGEDLVKLANKIIENLASDTEKINGRLEFRKVKSDLLAESRNLDARAMLIRGNYLRKLENTIFGPSEIVSEPEIVVGEAAPAVAPSAVQAAAPIQASATVPEQTAS